ncbi:hypothetical protein COLO4_19690 [Corchorus olitorius]|uniref:Uncharacterized protein n=1 Tax=Corchorus olitorius TaxID=93759 RepID=A0A1R3J3Z7_9ROSI|nr:hypothetical protein COLO4_19690 [Corchorus olitorius]
MSNMRSQPQTSPRRLTLNRGEVCGKCEVGNLGEKMGREGVERSEGKGERCEREVGYGETVRGKCERVFGVKGRERLLWFLSALTTALDAMCFGALQSVMSTVPSVRPIRAKALEMVSAVIKSTMATSPLTNATVAGHPIQHKPSIHYLLTPPFSPS